MGECGCVPVVECVCVGMCLSVFKCACVCGYVPVCIYMFCACVPMYVGTHVFLCVRSCMHMYPSAWGELGLFAEGKGRPIGVGHREQDLQEETRLSLDGQVHHHSLYKA